MPLAEEFALLAIQPDGGRPPVGKKDHVQLGLAALLLAELGQRGRIALEQPTGVWSWMDGAQRTVRVVDAGVLTEEHDHVLWLIPYDRHRVLDAAQRSEELDRLRGVALGDGPIDERDALLLAMVDNCQLLEVPVPERADRGVAKARIRQAQSEASYGPVVKAIIDAQSAAAGAAAVAGVAVASS